MTRPELGSAASTWAPSWRILRSWGCPASWSRQPWWATSWSGAGCPVREHLAIA